MPEFIIRFPVNVDGLGNAAWSGPPLEASIAVKVSAKGPGAALERLSRALELVAAELLAVDLDVDLPAASVKATLASDPIAKLQQLQRGDGTEVPDNPLGPEERDWELWTEGYEATGERGTAKHHATVRARSFKAACDQHFAGSEHYDSRMLTFWGCRLFKDERSARHSFG